MTPEQSHSLFPDYLTPLAGYVASESAEQTPDTSIGSSVSPTEASGQSNKSSKISDGNHMLNYPEAPQPAITASKLTQQLLAQASSSVKDRYYEALRQTGSPYGKLPNHEIWKKSHIVFEFKVTAAFQLLLRIMTRLCPLFEQYRSFGAELVQEKVEELGKKPEWIPTLRIRVRNSGAATKVKGMLSLMNSEEELTLPIYSDGSTGIRCEWRSREVLDHSMPKDSGSPLTLIPELGIQK